MPKYESESTVIACRQCHGSGRCPFCGGQREKKDACKACYSSGRCQRCGGSGKEVVSRRF